MYSNSDTYLLGLIIEAASGRSYAAYVESNIARPLGLSSTAFADESGESDSVARGYLFTGAGFSMAQNYDPLLPFSAGSLVSTLADIRRFTSAAYGTAGAAAVPQSVRRSLLAPVDLSGGQEVFYRLGSVGVLDFEGRTKIAHAGLTSGFTSYFAYYPDQDLTIVILTNTTGAARHPANLEAALARIVFGAPAPSMASQALSADEANEYAGSYRMNPFVFFGADTFGLGSRESGLVLQFGAYDPAAPGLPLVYQESDTFVSALDGEQVFRFRRDAVGRVIGFDLLFYAMPFRGERQ
jgi:CubicO group peptidase (beta-lactamase class C family)